MSPSNGLMGWTLIGIATGWFASILLRPVSRQRIAGDIIAGISGGILGGAISRSSFGGDDTDISLWANKTTAFFGACISIALLHWVRNLFHRRHPLF